MEEGKKGKRKRNRLGGKLVGQEIGTRKKNKEQNSVSRENGTRNEKKEQKCCGGGNWKKEEEEATPNGPENVKMEWQIGAWDGGWEEQAVRVADVADIGSGSVAALWLGSIEQF